MRFPKRNIASCTCLGAINIPADEVGRLAAERIPNKDVGVVVYCAGLQWHALDTAANEFIAMGYSTVRRYVGGKHEHDWLKLVFPHREGDQRAVA